MFHTMQCNVGYKIRTEDGAAESAGVAPGAAGPRRLQVDSLRLGRGEGHGGVALVTLAALPPVLLRLFGHPKHAVILAFVT